MTRVTILMAIALALSSCAQGGRVDSELEDLTGLTKPERCASYAAMLGAAEKLPPSEARDRRIAYYQAALAAACPLPDA